MFQRAIDRVGRVAIPIEYRQALGIRDSDHLDVSMESDKIIIKKSEEEPEESGEE